MKKEIFNFIIILSTMQIIFAMEKKNYSPSENFKPKVQFDAKKTIKEIYLKFIGNKKEIEKYIKQNFNSMPEKAIKLAKEYYYIYGKIHNIERLSEFEVLANSRKHEFLDIDINYGFSVQELIDNNKLPMLFITELSPNNYELDPRNLLVTLELSNLKIESLFGLANIRCIESVNNLYLDNNELKEIHENDFSKLKNLNNLYLNNNYISVINLNSLSNLNNLFHINLINNSFNEETLTKVKKYFCGKALIFISTREV